MKIQRALTIAIIFMMSLTTISSIAVSFNTADVKQELDLLHGETIYNITAPADTDHPFNISFVAPLIYGNQAPILFEVKDDTTDNVIAYQMLDDKNPPNKWINFTIAPLEKGENVVLNFDYWVLVKNDEYLDLPRYVRMPKEEDLPEDTKTWLVSTKSIQSDNLLIRLKAKQLKGLNDNLIKLANRVVLSTSNLLHRSIIKRLPILNKFYFRFRESIYNQAFKISGSDEWYKLQDASSALFLRGACYACAHLGVALFRANGVPARAIIHMPTFDQEMETHVMLEYYCPNYGWVPAETMFFSTPPKDFMDDIFVKAAGSMGYSNMTNPYETKSRIVLNIVYPEDENLAGGGLSYYGGIEPYQKVSPREIETSLSLGDQSPVTWANIKKEISTDQHNANIALDVTQDVYELHTKYLGMELTGDNPLHFNNAIMAQQNAIECFKKSDVTGYIENMIIAYDEYMNIN